jgi:hypothetical protein
MPTNVRDTGWFKSSRSNGGGDQCVECRIVRDAGTGVRDSKNPDAGQFWVAPSAWSRFLGLIASGEINSPS